MDKIIDSFKEEINKKLKNNLIKIILFGSRARGDNDEWSDYDLVVIVNKKDKETEKNVDDISGNLFFEHSKLIGSIVWDEQEWESKKEYPIGINILKDGVAI